MEGILFELRIRWLWLVQWVKSLFGKGDNFEPFEYIPEKTSEEKRADRIENLNQAFVKHIGVGIREYLGEDCYEDIVSLGAVQLCVMGESKAGTIFYLQQVPSPDDGLSIQVLKDLVPINKSAKNIKNTLIKAVSESIGFRDIEQGEATKLSLEIENARVSIAQATKRGSGNTFIVNKNSKFREALELLSNTYHPWNVIESNIVKADEIIIGYTGVSETDAGLIFIPTEGKKGQSWKYGIYIRPEFFRKLKLKA